MALEYTGSDPSQHPISVRTYGMADSVEVRRQQTLQRARSLARLLDSSIRVPGTRFRFGIDPLLGLIPGVGDVAGLALAGSILVAARGMREYAHIDVYDLHEIPPVRSRGTNLRHFISDPARAGSKPMNMRHSAASSYLIGHLIL